ncbi:MAG: DUF465 domain-containing protein [Pseudomonadota bacterium]
MTDDKIGDLGSSDTERQKTLNRFAAAEADFTGANDEALAIKLSRLEEEHRDLDNAISALERDAPYERLSIARLKKKKLAIKDRIQAAKDAMLPDIIA